jgi:hypothetical protein
MGVGVARRKAMAKSARSKRAKRRTKAQDLSPSRGGSAAKKMSAVKGGVYVQYNPKELSVDRSVR